MVEQRISGVFSYPPFTVRSLGYGWNLCSGSSDSRDKIQASTVQTVQDPSNMVPSVAFQMIVGLQYLVFRWQDGCIFFHYLLGYSVLKCQPASFQQRRNHRAPVTTGLRERFSSICSLGQV